MAAEHLILCGEAADGVDRPGEEAAVRLRHSGRDPVVRLNADDLAPDLAGGLPAELADLVEIAGFTYVADQCVDRGGDGVDDMGAEWRRRLHFRVPVRRPELWGRPDVADALREAVGFLSEDAYSFAFQPYVDPPRNEQMFLFGGTSAGERPERVVLFSGGLDSLGGAVREVVVAGRRIALVTHESTTKLRTRQGMLRGMLDARAAGPRPSHLTMRVNKASVLSREYTQRSRSFLYAAMAAAVARLHGLAEAWFYENGTVSLNLPISRQVVGAKATRTTHPRVLAAFGRLFSLVAGVDFTVRNGFQWLTKGEVVDGIVRAGCGGMIEWSTSCTHTWATSLPKPHCGTCSQCVDRRFAVLAGGAEAFERADTYGVDLLTDPRDEGEPRTMLASYVETAQQVAGMTEAEFFCRFGEAFRVVRALDGPPAENARQVYDLYRRHGAGVVRVVEQALARHVTAIRARTLPDSCLLRLVCDTAGPDGQATPYPADPTAKAAPASPAAEPRLAAADHVFRRKGDAWVVRFAGAEEFILLPSRGAAYLHLLLASPGESHSVFELALRVARAPGTFILGDAGERNDDRARAEYAARFAELEEELSGAASNHDEAAAERARRDMAALADELRDRRWGGRPKRERDDREKVRKAFRAAVGRAINDVGRWDKRFADHLNATVRCGLRPTYGPQGVVPDWDL
jgi:hypothetical protein